jgi:hypothetical protein
MANHDDKDSMGDIDDTTPNNQGDGETRMTKAKWLACLALGLSYTSAVQQGACLGAIVKSIDEALGMYCTMATDEHTNISK